MLVHDLFAEIARGQTRRLRLLRFSRPDSYSKFFGSTLEWGCRESSAFWLELPSAPARYDMLVDFSPWGPPEMVVLL